MRVVGGCTWKFIELVTMNTMPPFVRPCNFEALMVWLASKRSRDSFFRFLFELAPLSSIHVTMTRVHALCPEQKGIALEFVKDVTVSSTFCDSIACTKDPDTHVSSTEKL